MTARPNILIVILDATRADSCSCYGAERTTTPHLDRLAAQGVLYEQAISAAPWTLPAVASILTGLFPSQLGIHQNRRLPVGAPTLAELLGAAGYATFAISGNSWFSTDFGLPRGFGTMHKLWQWVQLQDDITQISIAEGAPDVNIKLAAIQRMVQGNLFANAANFLYYRFVQKIDDGASRTIAPLRHWVAQQSDGQPWFAFVHFLEAHLPYTPPKSWMNRFARQPKRAADLRAADQNGVFLRHNAGLDQLSGDDLEAWKDLYHAEVAYQDHYLGRLLSWLEESGQAENTCVIVLADHGENLGEHGLVNHLYSLHDTLIRVPLVIHHPRFFYGGHRVTNQVQTLDIFATALSLAGIEPPPTGSQNLQNAAHRPYAVAEYGQPRMPRSAVLQKYGLESSHFDPYLHGLTALRTANHKLIVHDNGSIELYDLQDDPGEIHNISDEKPEIVTELQEILAQWKAQNLAQSTETESVQEIDTTLAARLQALGYLD